MAEVKRSASPADALRPWFASCSLCGTNGRMRAYETAAKNDSLEHLASDQHRTNEVHQDRESRRG